MLARHEHADVTLQAYDKLLPDALFLRDALAIDAKRLKN
jgi:hypothetical protein